MENIKIGSRSYTVEVPADNKHVAYILTGVRGAHYYALRNLHRPECMYLVNDHMTVSPLGNLWITDRTGKLEVI